MGFPGNGINHVSRFNIDNATIRHSRRRDNAVITTFFAIAHGKLPIGGKSETRGVANGKIMRYISHALFFVCSEKHT